MLRGRGATTLEDLLKRYEEKKVPPRPHSVQMWERPPTEEILKGTKSIKLVFQLVTVLTSEIILLN